MRVCAGIVLLAAAAAFGQSQKFESVSIQPCDSKALHKSVSGSPGMVMVPCATVKSLIDWTYAAYSNGPHFNAKLSLPMEGAPGWIDTDRYSIDAKSAVKLDILTMFSGPPMRALLEDRFKLKLHTSSREVPVYAVTLGQGSLMLEMAQPGDCEDWEDPWDHPVTPPAPFLKRLPLCRTFQAEDHGLEVNGATVKEFAALLPLDRTVIDETGLTGTYNFHLDLSYQDLGMSGEGADPAERVKAARAALRKIGLDLQAVTGPREILVIDHIERPDLPAQQH